LLGGITSGLLFRIGENFNAVPAYANLQLRQRVSELFGKFWAAFKVSLMFGIIFGFIAGPIVGSETALRAGIAFVVVGTLMYGFAGWLTTPSEVYSGRISTPPSELRNDLRVTGAHVLGVAATIGAVTGIAFGPMAGSLVGVAFGLTGGLGTILKIPVPGSRTIDIPFGFEGVGTAAAAYIITTVILWKRHLLPLRLMRFLDDAHRLGLLRAVGPAYQFRELQDHLADMTLNTGTQSARRRLAWHPDGMACLPKMSFIQVKAHVGIRRMPTGRSSLLILRRLAACRVSELGHRP